MLPSKFILLRLAVVSLFLSACSAAYEGTAIQSWDKMASGNVDAALNDYKDKVKSAKDRLLFLMDEGILLRVAKRYEESNVQFLEAARIIDMAGYTDLGEEAATLLVNEKQKVYQGEDFEKTLIHAFLALNFIQLKNWDEALVEVRRVNEILFQMISEGKRPYTLNAFASYLGGLLYEKDAQINDALISYNDTLKIDSNLEKSFPVIKLDLMRTNLLMGFQDNFKELELKFGKESAQEAREITKNKSAQVVLIYESGKSPQKYSSREQHSRRAKGGSLVEMTFPVAYYRSRPSLIKKVRLNADSESVVSSVLNDIDATAKKHLEDRMGRAIAKALAQAAVKAGIATGIGMATDSKELGLLAGLALIAMSEADTRSWLLLPENLQVAKLYLKPGRHKLSFDFVDRYGGLSGHEELGVVDLKPNELRFFEARSFN